MYSESRYVSLWHVYVRTYAILRQVRIFYLLRVRANRIAPNYIRTEFKLLSSKTKIPPRSLTSILSVARSLTQDDRIVLSLKGFPQL